MGNQQPEQPNHDWLRWDSPWIRRILAAVAPLLGVFLCQLVTLQSWGLTLEWMGEHPGAVFFTYLVVLLA